MTPSCFNRANVEDLFECEYDFYQNLSTCKMEYSNNLVFVHSF